MTSAILLYDGTCGLCDRAVQFTLRHDRDDVFRFAPLQSEFAAPILERHGVNSLSLSTVVLVVDYELPSERILTRSDAFLTLLAQLSAPWRIIASIGRLCPRGLRDRIYDWIARNRYRIFGRHDVCSIPVPAQRKKFLA